MAMSKDQADIRHKEMMRLFYNGYSVMDAFIMTAPNPLATEEKIRRKRSKAAQQILEAGDQEPSSSPPSEESID